MTLIVLLLVGGLLAMTTYRGRIVSDWYVLRSAHDRVGGSEYIHDLEEAVRFDPENTNRRILLASAYDLADRWNDAIAESRQVLRRHPLDIYTRMSMIYSLKRGGRQEEALEAMREGARIDPANPRARLWLGSELVDAARYEEARPELLAVLRLDRGELADQAREMLRRLPSPPHGQRASSG